MVLLQRSLFSCVDPNGSWILQTTHIGRGLGAVIQLLLEDACIPYEFVFIDKVNEWPSVKASWIASNYHFDCMPMIEVEGGKRYSGCLPIMRFLSKKIGKYSVIKWRGKIQF